MFSHALRASRPRCTDSALEAGTVPQVPDGVTFAGGVPILRGGQLIGAIGTSGVRAVDDEQISQAGADAIAN